MTLSQWRAWRQCRMQRTYYSRRRKNCQYRLFLFLREKFAVVSHLLCVTVAALSCFFWSALALSVRWTVNDIVRIVSTFWIWMSTAFIQIFTRLITSDTSYVNVFCFVLRLVLTVDTSSPIESYLCFNQMPYAKVVSWQALSAPLAKLSRLV